MDPETPAPDARPSHGLVPPGRLVQIRSHARPVGQAEPTTTRVALRPIAAWRLDYGRFEFDSSFVEPEAALEIPHLFDLARRFPQSPISIFGHADPTGDDNYNKELSGRRALAIYGLLVRDVELWDELYQQESAGDRWGLRSVQRMLALLVDAQDQPYYSGPVDDWFGAGSQQALQHFQADHALDVDGIPGPLSRKALYAVYMDVLCTHPDGEVFALTDEDFLARGKDDGHRGDVQGCSEYNPARVFSEAEHAQFQAWANRDERNQHNAVNRRVTVFLYPADVEVDLEYWPCPAARTGAATCRERFWSDAQTRRNPQEARRHFDGDFDTFACRFYHHLGGNTPAETPVHLAHAFDVYLYREAGRSAPPGQFGLRSGDGVVDQSIPASDSIALRADAEGEVRCLRVTGLDAMLRYTLSFEGPDGDEEAVALVEDFTIAEYLAHGSGDDDAEAEVAYVMMDDETFLTYEPPPEPGPTDWSKPEDPDDWAVQQDVVDEDDLQITLTTISEADDE